MHKEKYVSSSGPLKRQKLTMEQHAVAKTKQNHASLSCKYTHLLPCVSARPSIASAEALATKLPKTLGKGFVHGGALGKGCIRAGLNCPWARGGPTPLGAIGGPPIAPGGVRRGCPRARGKGFVHEGHRQRSRSKFAKFNMFSLSGIFWGGPF